MIRLVADHRMVPAHQWIHLPPTLLSSPAVLAAPLPTPWQKSSAFFDSLPTTPRASPRPSSRCSSGSTLHPGKDSLLDPEPSSSDRATPCLSIGEREVKASAHYGYVYALVEVLEVPAVGGADRGRRLLASGSGAGDVKVSLSTGLCRSRSQADTVADPVPSLRCY